MALTAEYLDIFANDLPVEKFYTFGGVTYVFRIKKNSYSNIYTVEVYDSNNQTFLFSNKFTYEINLNDTVLSPIPDKIIPLNLKILTGSPGSAIITDNNLGEDIKIYTDLQEN